MTNVEIRDKLYEITSDSYEIFCRCYFTLLPKGYKNRGEGIITKYVAEELELEFKIDISDVMEGSSVVVFENLLKISGVEKEDLIDASLYNTQKKFLPRFDSISAVLEMSELTDIPMYVLTNDKQTFGAGVILYDGMYEKISRIVGDFIIIPSSLHETIIVPSVFDCPYITKMIREVNETVVAPDEVLSNRPYKLTPAGDLIEI